jgi:hypothetical protein
MSTKTMKNSMALGAAAILGIAGAAVITTSSPSSAMPVLAKTAAVSIAAPNPVTDVHYYRHGYRRHGYHRHGYYRHGYYGGGYGYPYGGYSYPYAYPYAYSYPFSFGWGWGGW